MGNFTSNNYSTDNATDLAAALLEQWIEMGGDAEHYIANNTVEEIADEFASETGATYMFIREQHTFTREELIEGATAAVADWLPEESAVRALRSEAGIAGDSAQVDVCDRALAGDIAARAECLAVILDARAQG